MAIHKINDRISFETSFRNEPGGFVHSATLFINNERMTRQHCHWGNRTWEAYPYQSVMKKCLKFVIARTVDEDKRIEYTKALNLLGD
jgi:hypothetical protein